MNRRNNGTSMQHTSKFTSSSRKSVLQGTKNFVWDREELSSNLPYFNRNYEIPFNRPPNEVNFLGGLGSNKAHYRSKVHPQRVSTVQKLMRMRTSNRMLETLTEDLRKVNLCRHSKKVKHRDRHIGEYINKITDELQLAGNVEKSTPSEQSDVQFQASARKNISNDDYKEMIQKLDKMLLDDQGPRASYGTTFRDWALRERYNFKNKNNIDMMKREKENLESEMGSSVDTKPCDFITADGRRVTKLKKATKIPHLEGYMYGPFTKLPRLDPLLESETKFGIPLSLLVRSYREMDSMKEGERNVINTRLAHMRIPLCPRSSDESSDDEDKMEEVKILSFIRTPYFRIPMIRTQKKRRKDRLRSRWLKKDRLKRITMLLYDRSEENMKHRKRSGRHRPGSDSDSMDSLGVKRRTASKQTKEEVKPELSDKRKRYFEFIEQKSLEYRRLYDECLKQRMTSFQDFKNIDLDDKLSDTSRSKSRLQKLKSPEEVKDPQERAMLRFPSNRFKSLSRSDGLMGSFYIDPEFHDKVKDLKMYKKGSKYYTSLMRGRVDPRLQVNAPDFDEEQLGFKTKFFNRLATEWDNYYIHELRYRPRMRKFCPKTDILNIREQRRKTFLQYYIAENLLKIREKQMLERKFAKWIKDFCKQTKPLFKVWKDKAYDKVLEMSDREKEAQQESKRLRNVLQDRQNKIQAITEKILLLEDRWTKIMQIRVSDAVRNCHSLFIRTDGLNIGTEIAAFYQEHIFPELEKHPSCTPDPGLFLIGLGQINHRTIELIQKYNDKLMVFSRIDYHYKGVLQEFPRYFSNHNDMLETYHNKVTMIQRKNEAMKLQVQQLLGEPLRKCVSNKTMRITNSILNQLYDFIRKSKNLGKEIIQISNMEKLAIIHQFIVDLLADLDQLPLDILRSSELEARKNRKLALKQANNALKRKEVFDLLRKQLRWHVKK
ncbi:AAEL009019-PA [Aedes aegypti]|uniref:AAEL009019-PA n=1 Tax=Aedes aegypti TaxID=7159 RepID=Q16X27_AEDAE|nr:AAEL009019-PA [Aedes aegypti]